MAISFVNKGEAAFSNTASPTVNLPASLQENDLLIMALVTATAHSYSQTGSWTFMPPGLASTGGDSYMSVAYRWATASEGSTEALTNCFEANESGVAGICAYRGVDTSVPVAARLQTTVAASTTVTYPNLYDVPEADCGIVAIAGCDPGASTQNQTVVPAGMEERVDYTGGAANGHLIMNDDLTTVAGADFTGDGTVNASDEYAVMVLLLLPSVANCQRRRPRTGEEAAAGGASQTEPWVNEFYIQNDQSIYSPANTAAMAANEQTEYLVFRNFEFSLPTGKVPTGIGFFCNKSCNNVSANVHDTELLLRRADGTLSTTNKATSTVWPGYSVIRDSFNCEGYGGSSDLWGEASISKADVEDVDFGVALSGGEYAGTAGAVLIVQTGVMSVHYADPATGKAPPFRAQVRPTIYQL